MIIGGRRVEESISIVGKTVQPLFESTFAVVPTLFTPLGAKMDLPVSLNRKNISSAARTTSTSASRNVFLTLSAPHNVNWYQSLGTFCEIVMTLETKPNFCSARSTNVFNFLYPFLSSFLYTENQFFFILNFCNKRRLTSDFVVPNPISHRSLTKFRTK